jgi:hypothetical protein
LARDLKLFQKFLGQHIKDVGDDIDALAQREKFSAVSYQFPDGINDIDAQPTRLHVFLDADHRVEKFGKG